MLNKSTSFLTVIIMCILLLQVGILAKPENQSVINLTKGWFLQSSQKISDGGEKISTSGYSVKNWMPVSVPSTVMGALVKNNVYKDLFMGNNLLSVNNEQFNKPWWFRTEFSVNKDAPAVLLQLNGIIYRANIWINGKLVADSGTVFGSYRQFEFNITKFISPAKKNTLAIEVFTAKPGEPNVGFVDWNPKAPDNNMGLWREVKIKTCGVVELSHPYVKSKLDTAGYKSAKLTVTTEVTNTSNEKVEAEIKGQIEKISFSQKVELNAGETKLVTFSADKYPQLKINNPRLWWTHDYGNQELYSLLLEATNKGKISDKSSTVFGIREVTDYFTKAGYRGYKLNGKNILIRGGGWADDMFLRQSLDNLKAQVEYAKHINLNTIRLEGIWGNDETLYELCDKEGIFLMVGWSCQWEWDKLLGKKCDDFGGISTPEEIDLISKSFRDQVKWLRNHPAVFVWAYASDLTPRPALEQKYLDILKEDDPTRPFLQSTGFKKTKLTGSSGVKMNGPYDYVPPVYWYTDTENGGAFGFNTETGPGPQVPLKESIKKFIPKDHLWPIDSIWNYHCCGNVFNSLEKYNKAIDERLGKPADIDEYLTKAQYTNYEGMRAMYEAFGANKYDATGIVQWMYNSAWPKLWWQLYDYYLLPNAALYGAKKACEPVHLQYNIAANSVEIVNQTLSNAKNIIAAVDVYDINMKSVFHNFIFTTAEANSSRKLLTLPEIKGDGKIYFLNLKLSDLKNNPIGYNFYVLPRKQDSLDFSKTTWWYTPVKEYADLKELNNLEKVKIDSKIKFREAKGKVDFEITLKNPTDKIAFSIEMLITKGPKGESVCPVYLDDNYVSLTPKETRVIKGYIYKKDLGGKSPALKINGWNLK